MNIAMCINKNILYKENKKFFWNLRICEHCKSKKKKKIILGCQPVQSLIHCWEQPWYPINIVRRCVNSDPHARTDTPDWCGCRQPFMSVLTLAFAAAVFSVLSPGQFPVAIADGLPTPAWAFQVSTLPGRLQWSNAC